MKQPDLYKKTKLLTLKLPKNVRFFNPKGLTWWPSCWAAQTTQKNGLTLQNPIRNMEVSSIFHTNLRLTLNPKVQKSRYKKNPFYCKFFLTQEPPSSPPCQHDINPVRVGGGRISTHFFQMFISPWKKGSAGPIFRAFS